MSTPKDRGELAKIEKAIVAQEALRGIFPAPQIEALLRPLLEKRAALRALHKGSGALVKGRSAVAATARGVAVGRDIAESFVNTGRMEGNVYIGPATADPEEALRIYQEMLASTCSDVLLRAVDVATSDATGQQKGMDLAAVYIDLDTTDINHPVPRRGKHALSSDERARPLRALEAVALHRKLVILGDPGSGKSTFIRYITRCLAAGAVDPKGGWREPLAGWPRAVEGILPVLVILRDFARVLPAQAAPATPQQLWDFIATRLHEQNLAFAKEPILAALEEGRALVLFDGLDEVPTNDQRGRVRDAVAVFMARYPKSDFLVTCRTLSYQDPAWQLPDLRSFTLAPFDDPKIDRFITAWYAELSRRNVVTSQQAAELSSGLAEAVKRPDLARLAPSPLLLTVMALVHASRGRLPDARARLYEETVDLLLWHREELKTRRLRELLDAMGLADTDLKRVLSRIAFEAHSAAPLVDGDALAGIEEHQIEQAIAAMHPEGRGRDWAHDVVEAMKLRAGLLLERAPGVYTFPHRTFQEYLAGAHLSAQEDFTRRAADLARRGRQWREVILLAVGRLVHVAGNTDRPLALVGELCSARAADDEGAWQNAWLAGDVLLEVGLHRLEGSQLGADLAERVPQRLVELLQKGRLRALERAKVAEVLGALGDPRFSEEAWGLPREGILGFVEVTGGKFWMGSDQKLDKQAKSDELPMHEVDLPTYWIGKYPVTVGQFRAFVHRSKKKPQNPLCLHGLSNHPVVNVTLEDVIEYSAWLTEELRAWPQTPEPLASLLRQNDKTGHRWHVTLPSEAEWEKAARGSDGRIYPWNEAADSEHANYKNTEIRKASAVGCFRAGVSPYGCEEMSGNVWEWTRSLWGKSSRDLEFKYPYNPEDGREDAEAAMKSTHVLRGGAFGCPVESVRCAVRGCEDQHGSGGKGLGFRVVVSPYLCGEPPTPTRRRPRTRRRASKKL